MTWKHTRWMHKGYFVVRDLMQRSCTLNIAHLTIYNVSVKIEINTFAVFALTDNSLPSLHFQAQQVFHRDKWCGSLLLCQEFKKRRKWGWQKQILALKYLLSWISRKGCSYLSQLVKPKLWLPASFTFWFLRCLIAMGESLSSDENGDLSTKFSLLLNQSRWVLHSFSRHLFITKWRLCVISILCVH